jgi:uncharacterized protein YdhG (YjbR/CyaY superfamily)
MKKGTSNSVAQYISSFPKTVATRLLSLRKVIRTVAPSAEEVISYGIPAYRFNKTLKGRLLYFAAYEKHIGLYPAFGASLLIQKKLQKYRQGKGTFRFPHDTPLPLPLIRSFIESRAKSVSKNISKS